MTADLPFGLRAYEPGEFERVHAAGSGILTASNIPALFGHGRFAGRYAIAAHISGRVELGFAGNAMTERGHELEPIAAKKLEAHHYHVAGHPLGIWAPHPTIPKFISSPDRVAWHLDEMTEPLLVEIKVVAEPIFKDKWADGPPLEVELQHQTQLACCPGAKGGIIAALVVGAFRFELVTYETARNEGAIALIEGAARSLLDMLEAGEMPPPDSHESAARVIMALHPIDPLKEVILSGEEAEEAGLHWHRWNRASEVRKRLEKIEKASKSYFLAVARDATRVVIGNGQRLVTLKDIHKKAYSVQETTYREVRLKSVDGT